MTLKLPDSMDDCVYFTRRTGKGSIIAWVPRELCPKCKKSVMGKPVEKGKVKIRAPEYTCKSCSYTVPKEEYEDGLTANIIYTCPHCSAAGEAQLPFKRKKVQVLDEESGKKVSVDVLRFQCAKCKQNIDIAKKMKI
ncbi:hypothetical protein HY642_04390 [Candidatus Woesearchaeota archaeon]|nr:hypothetical protein [Candidatus Woesearchaeota archaeon]